MVSVPFLLTSSFALFSIILYFLTSATILRFRLEFNSSYYSLYLLSSAVNTATYLNSFFVIRLPYAIDRNNTFSVLYKSSNDDEPTFHSPIFDVLNFFTNYFGHIQYGLSAIISYNRFLVIVLPFSHKRLWKRTFVPLIVLLFLPPFALFMRPQLFRLAYKYDNSTEGFVPVTEFVKTNWPLLMVGFLSLFSLINTILNTVIMIRITRIFTTCASNTTIKYYGSRMIPYASDLLTLLSPYGLLICDGRLRKFFIFRKKPEPPLCIQTM